VHESRQKRLPGRTTDAVAFGRAMLDHWAAGVERMVAARASLGEGRFVDVGQSELEADPLATADRVFDSAGLRVTTDVRAAMVAWAEQNRRGARGEHRYDASEFGITDADIRAAFGSYLDRFGDLCRPSS